MSDYLDDFNGPNGAALPDAYNGFAWWTGGTTWLYDGAGHIAIPLDAGGQATIDVADANTTLRITSGATNGEFYFGTSGSGAVSIGNPYNGAQCAINFGTQQVWLQSTYASGASVWIGETPPPWELRLEAPVGATTIRLYLNDILISEHIGTWAESGVGAFSKSFIYSFGDGAGSAIIDSLSGGVVPPDSGSDAPPFWTSFVATREEGVTIVPPSPPGGDGSSKDDAFPVTAPYETTVAEGMDGTPIWWKVTVPSDGMWRFTTRYSSDGIAYDTWLGLYDSTGAVLASHDDIDTDNNDYRSLIEISLTAADYYLVLSTYPASAAAGFVVTPGDVIVPAGTVVTIEAF